MASKDIRVELAELGERRRRRAEDDADLAKDVERTLRRAYGKVPVAEAARLVGIHRTTVYRVYHPHD